MWMRILPDWMSVHHHDEIVQRFSEVRSQLGLILERLLAGEVEDVRLGDVIVDDGHAVVVPHERRHRRRRPVHGVRVVGLGPRLQQQRADGGFGGQSGKVETRVIVFVIASIGISTFSEDFNR